ncbi:response regulator transcription factor [Persicobacter diffluens]|uniref:Transcriptional regulatory protein RprY n=1 Tax=Persicobacter diffluens TaxID=981 RepID=A0AAN5AL66_9BACT|nr:transcriptional regulatory protein RprY [Persicobacter diffluens]
MIKILLAEDNDSLGYILKEYLELNDYEVVWTKDGGQAWDAYCAAANFDLCLLDVMMPVMDGFELGKKIRSVNEYVPLMFLTAKSLKIDKLKGYKLGADDYIVKPIDEDELLARIRALLRRAALNKEAATTPAGLLLIGSFQFDPEKRMLTNGEEEHHLTGKETEILKMLIHRKNKLLSRDDALKTIWQENDYFARRSMDVHISKLRKYLSSDSALSINNVHGKGFVLEEK